MISFWRRIIRLIAQKLNVLLQNAEDPVEALDLLDREYVKDVGKMRRHIAAVLSAEKRLQLEALRLHEQERNYERVAGDVLTSGDEQAARTLLARAALAREHLGEIESGYAGVSAQRKELEAIGEEMQTRLEGLRVRRQTARAESVASRALIAAREWMLPLSSAGLAREESLALAHEALLRLRSRSEALSEFHLQA